MVRMAAMKIFIKITTQVQCLVVNLNPYTSPARYWAKGKRQGTATFLSCFYLYPIKVVFKLTNRQHSCLCKLYDVLSFSSQKINKQYFSATFYSIALDQLNQLKWQMMTWRSISWGAIWADWHQMTVTAASLSIQPSRDRSPAVVQKQKYYWEPNNQGSLFEKPISNLFHVVH